MKSNMNRRRFLKATSAGVIAGGALPQLLSAAPLVTGGVPTRALGKTGAKVSMIGIGCGTKFSTSVWQNGEEFGQQLIGTALDRGVNYLDTAAIYTYLKPDGERGPRGFSERVLGKVMKLRRGDAFLASKTLSRDRDGALRDVETSLKNLQTDHLDLIQMHSLSRPADLDQMAAEEGCFKALGELKEQKVVRNIGISCHQNGELLKSALERFELDTVLMALNAAQSKNPIASGGANMAAIPTFESHALPTALKQGLGVIAMKTLGFGLLVGNEPGLGKPADLIRYNLSLPVSTVIIGTDSLEILEENVKLAKTHTNLPERQMDQLRQRMAPSLAMMNDFFQHHGD